MTYALVVVVKNINTVMEDSNYLLDFIITIIKDLLLLSTNYLVDTLFWNDLEVKKWKNMKLIVTLTRLKLK